MVGRTRGRLGGRLGADYQGSGKSAQVHISNHQCYRTMYDYLRAATQKKPQMALDQDPWISPNHPSVDDLPAPPERLVAAWGGRADAARRTREGQNGAMTVLEFYDLLKGKQDTLLCEKDIWTFASSEDAAGNRRLLSFLLSRRDLPNLRVMTQDRQPCHKISSIFSYTVLSRFCFSWQKLFAIAPSPQYNVECKVCTNR